MASSPQVSSPSGHGLSSLYADRKIGTKIMIGFALVLIIMAAIAAVSYRGFGSIERAFTRFAEGVDEVALVRNIDREFVGLQRLAREYMLATVALDPQPVRDRKAAVEAAIAQGVARISVPERTAKLRDLAAQFKAYSDGFETIVPLKNSQADLRRTVLGPVGGKLTDQVDQLQRAVMSRPTETGDGVLAGAILKSFLLIRVNVSKAFGRIEDTADAQAVAAYKDLEAAVTKLGSAVGDSDVRRLVDAVRTGAAAYFDGFRRYMAIEQQIVALVNTEMPKRAEAIGKDTVAIRDDAIAEQNLVQTETKHLLATTMTFVGVAALGGLLLGVLLSWIIGRGISHPIVRIGEVLVAIAGGDRSVEIPYVGRRDEVGANARAAQSFKDNLVRLVAMEADQRAADERAARERQAAVHKIADEFEAAVGEIVETVSAAATELEAASGSLTKTAETTQRLSTTVASASEEASANVESVASATTEMTSSVNEISRQVQESTRIAAAAVKQAEKTDSRIGELSQAASRIGDVVKMITAIAEQTNLLALNATIEAARAGESGRGFAVVANEVKALASQTAKATGEIGAQIAGMQAATHDSVTAIKEIGGTIGRVAEIAAAIAAAVEEQGAATAEVARNIQQASHGTAEVARTIGEVSRGAGATEAASEQVRSSATMLAVEGSKLKDEVRRFLMNVRTGPLDRRETDDPGYTGPERRTDRVVTRRERAA
ncbi:MAG: methyl-accepting chemotaxis protein [Rhodoplanes sp.]|uniref:methyl-accepting chemotaxis protein n=1 Tax=Rhodoplanes sp. TaxID=1968906 RepID=UPI00184FCD89|nr:methyl-accepting chemotaxis protein [Rhodoplanes sp.]NVO14112.1 methyl-accepting chemotaxis protein [Rhodoplanes sp.]